MKNIALHDVLHADAGVAVTGSSQADFPVIARQDLYARTKKLRIAVLSDAQSERNGVGAYYHDLVGLLREHVDDIRLFCPGSSSDYASFRFPLPGDATQKVEFPSMVKVSAHVKALDPHIIIVPTPGPYGLLGARLAKKCKAALIVGFHTHFEKIMGLYYSRFFGFLTVSYFETLNRYLFHRSCIILANSNDMVSVAKSRSSKPVKLMGTPIPQAFLNVPAPEINPQVRTVLSAGRLAAEKNIPAFIDAARNTPEIEFLIAGDGPQRELVEAAQQELPNLRYLGWLSRQDMLALIDEIDMLVLPSHVESFGTIAMEAMARGRLVLVSAKCGITEWGDLRSGLYEIRTEESVADAITRVANDDYARRLEVSQKAREGAKKINQWNLENWLQILNEHAVLEHDELPSAT